ncbi:MAG TPA: GFA family protein [Kofleriaceae bacterium]|nr:GFA family protein [Kofleriaceae bacterium]
MAALEGGCACGEIRYRLDDAPYDCGYCHCRLCQRSSGAPVLVFASVKRASFVVTKGQPRRRISSHLGERWFCDRCGTQLAMLVDDPDAIDFTVATLDDPDAIAPSFHIWTDKRISWFDTRDDLPRHARGR